MQLKEQAEEQEMIIMAKARELLKVKRIEYEEKEGETERGVDMLRKDPILS